MQIVRFNDLALAHYYNRQSVVYAGCLERLLYDIIGAEFRVLDFCFFGYSLPVFGGVSDVR